MSLRNKLFVSFAVISLLLLAFIFIAVELRVRQQVSTDVEVELEKTDAAFVEQWQFLRDRLAREGAIVADAPKMKAALDTGDRATIEPVAADYRQMIGADLLELRDPTGRPLVRLTEDEGASFLELSFPIVVGNSMLGSLTTGYSLNQAFAARMKRLVSAEVAVVGHDGVVASTLPKDREDELAASPPALSLRATEQDHTSWNVRLGGETYLVRMVSEQPAPGVKFLILRSVDESLRFLGAVRRDLFLLAVAAMVLALGASYWTARTLTRPLAAIVEGMRETARSGDLTRQIHLDSHDEEASLLASTFNHVASSLLAFQQQARHKERLSSLGKLSATLAHEIRNPLTIIKGSALQLLEEKSLGQDEREAAADIIQEVDRLNRLVQSVLDSARPNAFQVEDVDINDLCQDCLAAVADSPGVSTESAWDPRLQHAPVDPARLKQVLLNLLLNAREALTGPGTIRIATRRNETDYAISVSDTGRGIASQDIPNIFDPFFTQKPNGTGLGLSVARNIVEGLGGTISVQSLPGRGTEVEIRLPLEPRTVEAQSPQVAET